jgi:alkaline phosphatase D
MIEISRRAFLETAVALGASAAWGTAFAAPSRIAWRERRDLYPEGVASGDPTSDSCCCGRGGHPRTRAVSRH